MSKVWLIAKRECMAAFESPVGYVVLATLPILMGLFFFVLGNFFIQNDASMRDFFAFIPIVFILIAPAITMRMWAEESRAGTEELLLAYPIRVRDLVLGKFLGACALLACGLLATGFIPLTVWLLGPLDLGPVVGGYFGSLMLGGACLAAGLFLSALTRNQIVAWLLGVLLLASLHLPGLLVPLLPIDDSTARFLLAFDLHERFQDLSRGVIAVPDVAYFVGIIALFLCLMGLVIETRRAR